MRGQLLVALDDFKRFKSMSVCLQRKEMLLYDLRFTLDEACKDDPSMLQVLGSVASIVCNKRFEKSIKNITGREQDIKEPEKIAAQ